MNIVETHSSGSLNMAKWSGILFAICIVPLVLLWMGTDLSTDIGTLSELSTQSASNHNAVFHSLRGSFTHTLLEWTAVCVAAFVALLTFVHYRLKREPSVPIIGMALICAGCMDAFHTLAADRLMSANVDNQNLIPFTWAICRLFNASILLVGVALVVWFPVVAKKDRTRFVAIVSCGFIASAYLIMSYCAGSAQLPQTMFPNALIKRPYDIYPIIPYVVCAVYVFPRYWKRNPTIFAQTLIVGLIPAVATQLYMAFGSYSLHDSCFNIAHAAKVISYTVPLVGLLVEYSLTYQAHKHSETELRTMVSEMQSKNVEMASVKARAEQAYVESNKQAIELKKARMASINIMKDALASRQEADAASAAKSDFLANMSHEIRTPMTAILGFTETLLDSTQSSSEKLNAVYTVRRNGEHLLQLINDILDISKIEAGKLDVECVRCSPISVLSDVLSIMRVRSDAKNLFLKAQYVGAIPETIKSDPLRFKQILVNLVGNAIKFTETGGVQVVVRLVEGDHDSKMQFEVIDTGIGIAPAQANSVFKAFSQADTSTTRKFGGTGLGLMISRRLSKMMGGNIVFESRPGEGSVFRVTLATGLLDGVKMVEDPNRAAIVRPNETEESKVDTIECRVLLAEDGPDNQRLIKHVLKKAGANVTVVENGKRAVDSALAAVVEGNAFDVILMDMQMPIMGGYEAVGLLRERNYTGTIIALTAHAMTGDRQKCIDAGCDDYATKPIDRKKLIATIHQYLQEGESILTAAQNTNDALISEFADDEDMLELVEMFVDELPDRVASIQAALDANDIANLGGLAHQVSGAAGGYGFPTITDVAKELELAAKNQCDLDELRKHVESLTALCGRAKASASTR